MARRALDTAPMKLRIGRREVNISNPDKSLPERGLKMLDLVNHYLDVADCVLNHEPADPTKLDGGRRRGRAQRWESDQRSSWR